MAYFFSLPLHGKKIHAMCQCAQMEKIAQDVELGNRTGCLIPPLVSFQTPIEILANVGKQ
jgi:hypothetical protein